MKVIDFECRDYETAAKLSGGRSRTKVCYGTILVRSCWIEDEPIYHIELHGHKIVSFFFDGRILVDGHRDTIDTDNPNGWWTLTTKKRINACLPTHVKLFQKRTKWYLKYLTQRDPITTLFYDGYNVGQLNIVKPVHVTGIAQAVTSV